MNPLTLSTIPTELFWHNRPLDHFVDAAGNLTIVANRETDWFVDPAGALLKDNAPAALFVPPDRDFILSARVTVEFGATYDAGVLELRTSATLGAKLCFEYAPPRANVPHQPMIVSVVTRGISDDCNSTPIQGNAVYLRLARNERTIAFHYSLDGHDWQFVRYFTLGELDSPQVGFSAQSPTGLYCRAVFSEIHYRAGILDDLRNGA